jgi:ABC-type sugar transport system ATPase subunit
MSAGVVCRGVTKRYAGVVALDRVSFEIAAGSCHALCGENGAGKSTLGKILVGAVAHDAGMVVIGGRARRFASPREALAVGMRLVHQEFAFCERLSVAENLMLGAIPVRKGVVDRQAMIAAAQAAVETVGSRIDVRRLVETLAPGERQLVQIAGAVRGEARVIVFDEPTSSLSEGEARRLLALIRTLVACGTTCVYVSHRLHEVVAIADAVTVLRDGRHVATLPASRLSEQRIVGMMSGGGVRAPGAPVAVASVVSGVGGAAAAASGVPRLEVTALSSPGKFAGVSFAVSSGEILGIAGLVGAGRTEVLRAIFGADGRGAGSVRIDGRPVRLSSPGEAIRAGVGLVPEDRKTQGLVLGMTATANTTLTVLPSLATLSWIARREERAVATRLLTRLRVRGLWERGPVSQLSGGNQQKVVMARWVAAKSRVLLLDEPTRGVDVGAKAELHAVIRGLADSGSAVVLVSSDLAELLAVADRILVMRGGRVAGEVSRAEATADCVLAMMLGAKSARVSVAVTVDALLEGGHVE